MEKVLILLVIITDLKMSWCSITVGISAAMIVIYLAKKKKTYFQLPSFYHCLGADV